MRIQTNTAANSALGNMRVNSQATERSIQRLSSGFRINRSADDAAGLAIANKLRNESRTLQQAQRNGAQANAMLQIADGGVQTIASILDRMKELAAASASDNIGGQRSKLDAEFDALNDEIQRIVDTTKYQGTALLNGSGAGSFTVAASSTIDDIGTDVSQVILGSNAAAGTWTIDSDEAANGVVTITNGATSYKALAKDGAQDIVFAEAGITIKTGLGFKIGDGTDPSSFDGKTIVIAAGTPVGTSLSILLGATGAPGGVDRLEVALPQLQKLATADLTTLTAARTAMGNVDTLLDTVNSFIGTLGSLQSRVDFANQTVAVTLQNTQAAESAIRDADMAYEMTQFTKNNILSQAAQSMLAQANQGQQGVLQLLRG
jgi:flagellin